MTILAPAITRSREILSQKTSQVALKLVPDISDGKQADRKFFATFVSLMGIGGLLTLLFVNTLLAQDAFALSHLKLQAKSISDQREAISRQIELKSSPESLAQAATALGMKPSETPTFLYIDKPVNSIEIAKNG